MPYFEAKGVSWLTKHKLSSKRGILQTVSSKMLISATIVKMALGKWPGLHANAKDKTEVNRNGVDF